MELKDKMMKERKEVTLEGLELDIYNIPQRENGVETGKSIGLCHQSATAFGTNFNGTGEVKSANTTNGGAFPVEVFPEFVQSAISATNASLNYPIDFSCASILFTTSLAIGNSYNIKVKDGWHESAVVYIAIVGRAGTNKSHPLSFFLQPIFERDKQSYKEFRNDLKEYERVISLPQGERKEQGINLKKPEWNKLLVSDFTPEALVDVHDRNQRGLGVYVDELAGWFKNFNRYNKSNEEEFWLSNWSNKPLYIDRKTSASKLIPKPFISVVGAIQNSILDEIAKDNRSKNGFIDRILFAMPENLKKEYLTDSNIEIEIIDGWRQVISHILEIPFRVDEYGTPFPTTLEYTSSAWAKFSEWQKGNTDLCNEAENEAIASIYSKLEIYVNRLALIFQLLYWSCNEGYNDVVSERAIDSAIKCVEYFRYTALKVNNIITNSSPLDNLPSNHLELYDALPEHFTTGLGVELAKQFQIAERTFKRWINNKALFKCIKHGEYGKLL